MKNKEKKEELPVTIQDTIEAKAKEETPITINFHHYATKQNPLDQSSYARKIPRIEVKNSPEERVITLDLNEIQIDRYDEEPLEFSQGKKRSQEQDRIDSTRCREKDMSFKRSMNKSIAIPQDRTNMNRGSKKGHSSKPAHKLKRTYTLDLYERSKDKDGISKGLSQKRLPTSRKDPFENSKKTSHSKVRKQTEIILKEV